MLSKAAAGDFCELPIEEIRQDDHLVTVVARMRISSGTGISLRTSGMSATLDGDKKDRTFPTWPRRGRSLFVLSVSPDRLPSEGPDLRRLLILNKEQRYTVDPGRPLQLCRFMNQSGLESSVTLRVTPGDRFGL